MAVAMARAEALAFLAVVGSVAGGAGWAGPQVRLAPQTGFEPNVNS